MVTSSFNKLQIYIIKYASMLELKCNFLDVKKIEVYSQIHKLYI